MSSRPPNAKIQILLVEDSIEEVFLLRALLERGGPYQITHSQDGDQAARLFKEREFDLVITDLNLPGIDGYDLIRMIKSARPSVPVLTTTGYTADHYVEHAYRAGANHVLTKPLDREELLKRVAELLAGGPSAPKPPAVLAIGALPGDVEGGCGGTLIASRERGDEVLLLPLRSQSRDGSPGAEAERRGAELLGARVIIPDSSVSPAENPTEHQMLLERIVHEMEPHTVLIPSLADDNVDRREAHRISRALVADVPTVHAYETATATLEFRPTLFVDIAAHLDRKLEVLTAYRDHGRPDLETGYAEAVARHWGRHLQFGRAEAFEVLRDQGKAPA